MGYGNDTIFFSHTNPYISSVMQQCRITRSTRSNNKVAAAYTQAKLACVYAAAPSLKQNQGEDWEAIHRLD